MYRSGIVGLGFGARRGYLGAGIGYPYGVLGGYGYPGYGYGFGDDWGEGGYFWIPYEYADANFSDMWAFSLLLKG
jgi:hypothetical protein